MTYTALLSLSILRDSFAHPSFSRKGLSNLLHHCQRDNGSFTTTPKGYESDLRVLYCAFVICKLIDDWTGIDVEKAIRHVQACRTYEGGYGQEPGTEAHAGPTYTALASLHLVPENYQSIASLSTSERRDTLRWLCWLQDSEIGGFRGRPNKEPDACYSFWVGGSLAILNHSSAEDGLVSEEPLYHYNAMAQFLSHCQFKYGGIAKDIDETPDPYHTYLSVAALSIYPSLLPAPSDHDPTSSRATSREWAFDQLDPLINARHVVSSWAKEKISSAPGT